jgi:hypothetical protein
LEGERVDNTARAPLNPSVLMPALTSAFGSAKGKMADKGKEKWEDED